VLTTALASIVAIGWGGLFHRLVSRSRSTPAGGEAFVQGMQEMFPPALILVLAWTLNSVIKELETARYLVALLGERMPAEWLPSFVFVISSLISFSTGTSWGTLAVVTPLIVPLAVSLTEFQAGMTESPVLIGAVGAVLAGSVFGDHCSPISDTTIVSAFSSGCDVVAHVRTQLPYALAAAVLATILGYLPAGYGISPGWLLALGGFVCWAGVRYGGKRQ
jgi:Na+/H+ antiporter NhaC